MSETRFYVEIGDGQGNTGRPRAVIEATTQPYPPGWTEPYDERFTVVAPPEIATRWPTIVRGALFGWKEVQGPARMLSFEEWKALVAEPDDIACGELDQT